MGFQNTFRDNLELRKVKAPQGLYGSQVIFLGLFISKNCELNVAILTVERTPKRDFRNRDSISCGL